MNEFQFYLRQGINHILDLDGIDHMLFVVSIAVIYSVKEWKKLLTVVTAFTLGHSITLALSSLEVVRISPSLVELLIPITILITCISNILKVQNISVSLNQKSTYIVVLLFGLIHGLGFSTFFKAMMLDADNIIKPLFGFNLGIELGQLFIVAVQFALLAIATLSFKKLNNKMIVIVVSGLIGLKAIQLIVQNLI